MVKLATPEQAQEKKATRAAFGVTLAELAASGKKVVAVDAAPPPQRNLLRLVLKTQSARSTLVLPNRT